MLDFVLAAKKPCTRYDQSLKKYKNSPEFQSILKKYKTLFQYLEQQSGAQIETLDQAQYLYNTFYIEQLRNYT